MSWLDNLRIPAKSGVLLATIALVVVPAFVWTAASLNHAQDLADEVAVANSEVAELRHLRLSMQELDSATTKYLNNPDDVIWRTEAERKKGEVSRLVAAVADQPINNRSNPTGESQAEHLAPLVAIEEWLASVIQPSLSAADAVANGTSQPRTLAPWKQELADPESGTAADPFSSHIDEYHAELDRDLTTGLLIDEISTSMWRLLFTLVAAGVLVSGLLLLLARNLSGRFATLHTETLRIGDGDLEEQVELRGQDEIAALADGIERIRVSLSEISSTAETNNRAQQNLLDVSVAMQGSTDAEFQDEIVLHLLMEATGAATAVMFLTQTDAHGHPTGMFARSAVVGAIDAASIPEEIRSGEGLAGRTAEERITQYITTPPDYLAIQSALGEAEPAEVAILPCVAVDQTVAVIELAHFVSFQPSDRKFLQEAAEQLGLQIAVRNARERTERLLERSQSQAEELEAQSHELETQAQELQEANASLESGSARLEEQQELLQAQKGALEQAHSELVSRAELLDRSSQYKSAFLAKMSHELRTPLNSIMILSDRLVKNADGNLTARQVEFADTIHACGKDLLALITDVLDLSKVESGRIDITPGDVSPRDLCNGLIRQLQPLADERGLELVLKIDDSMPEQLQTDRLRVEQILRNLLSNALKFTDSGTIRMTAEGRQGGVEVQVTDSGIGVSEHDMSLLFEPFAQVDQGNRRKVAGTGLGLAISRELARRMGGDLTADSEVGVGSTFTLTLPATVPDSDVDDGKENDSKQSSSQGPQSTSPVQPYTHPPRPHDKPRTPAKQEPATPPAGTTSAPGKDDENDAGPQTDLTDSLPGPDQNSLLVIEDDAAFARIVADQAASRGFHVRIAPNGAAAMAAIEAHTPDAITLDLGLPDTDGWVLLDRIRRLPATRHIPIQIISASEAATEATGVIGKLVKPVDEASLSSAIGHMMDLLQIQTRRLLLIEDDQETATAFKTLLSAGEDGLVTTVCTHAEALSLLSRDTFDAIVLDIGPNSDLTLVEQLRSHEATSDIPLIVMHDIALEIDTATLSRMASAVITKDETGRAHLLDETARFLNRLSTDLPSEQQDLIDDLYESNDDIEGRRILVVDDDPRNVFSLAAILEDHGLDVVDAENGQEALDLLAADEGTNIDLVLMDVMMPVLDGIEATRRLRDMGQFASLPVIAVTALAMQEDRERALAAGVSDYLTKPIDEEQLMSMIRVWLNARG